jgi:hypothetical protein
MSNTYYMKKKLTMIKEKGHGSREGGGAFMSNTNHMKNKLTMIREGTWKKGRWWRIYV